MGGCARVLSGALVLVEVLAVSTTLAVASPPSGRRVRHTLASVAAELAVTVRRDARADRHASGTLIRQGRRGPTETLFVYYSARPVLGAAYGEYELTVVTNRRRLEEITLQAFGQEHAFPFGSTPASEVSYELRLVRSHSGTYPWTTQAGGREIHPCTRAAPNEPPTPCIGTAWTRECNGEYCAAGRVLAEAAQLIAAARHHEPV